MNPVDLNNDLYEGAAATLSGGVVNRGFHVSGQRYFPRKLEDITAGEEYDFASSHVRWCSSGFLAAVQRGDALIQQIQGADLLLLPALSRLVELRHLRNRAWLVAFDYLYSVSTVHLVLPQPREIRQRTYQLQHVMYIYSD